MSFWARSIRTSGRVLIRVLLWFVLPITLLGWAMLSMPGTSFQGALPAFTAAERALAAALEKQVQVIAREEHNTTRPLALEDVALHLESELAAMGYAVQRQVFKSRHGVVRNLEVEVRGTALPEEIVIVGAHYDSARGTPGANDNGSGTAMTLELARRFHGQTPARTLRFVFFVNEEPPYFKRADMGSRVYADRSAERRENIVAMLSLETLGYYDELPGSQHYPMLLAPFFPTRGNFVAFVSNFGSRDLLHRSLKHFRATTPFPSEGIAAPSFVTGVDWSDHASFWRHGWPALMLSDTAIFRYPQYHGRVDTPDQLDYPRMARITFGIERVIEMLTASEARVTGPLR